MHYQLQLPRRTGVIDLAQAAGWGVWRVIAATPEVSSKAVGASGAVTRAVEARITARSYAYDTCGLYRSCLDAARPAEWNEHGSVPTALCDRHALTLMHLDLPAGLPGFEEELVQAAGAAAGIPVSVLRADRTLRRDMGQVVRRALGPYLFVGELCEVEQKLRAAGLAEAGREAAV